MMNNLFISAASTTCRYLWCVTIGEFGFWVSRASTTCRSISSFILVEQSVNKPNRSAKKRTDNTLKFPLSSIFTLAVLHEGRKRSRNGTHSTSRSAMRLHERTA